MINSSVVGHPFIKVQSLKDYGYAGYRLTQRVEAVTKREIGRSVYQVDCLGIAVMLAMIHVNDASYCRQISSRQLHLHNPQKFMVTI